MNSLKDPMKKVERYLDSQLWHACAGGMVQMPQLNSKVFYFPQGHAEQAQGTAEFGNYRIPSLIPCQVSVIRYMADPDTDEAFARIRLIPLPNNGFDYDDNDLFIGNTIGSDNSMDKPVSFAKTLTQSDANNGGGFSVPRYCAETIFPRLDYSAEPPVQTILAKDMHGEVWKFRHIYRGTPRRHLLTTGWSNFVNQKKLVAGDSIVFLRAENGDLCVGIRRAKKGIGGGPVYSSGWNPMSENTCGGSPFGGYGGYVREDENNKMMRKNYSGDLREKARAKSVVEAAILAANGQPFEVVYYPRASTPEFFVKASAVRSAMQIQWCSGMRFKMPFETEDSSRISWFMGTVSAVQVADPIYWPNSPWRLLQVAWDEPDLLQNVKRVSPWLVELVSNMPSIHLSPFSSPRKKLRFPPLPDFPLMNQHSMPSFPGNPIRSNSPLCCLSDHIPTGIQGARHAQFGIPSSDPHNNKLQSDLFPIGSQQLDHAASLSRIPSYNFMRNIKNSENISCLLTMGNPTQSPKENNETKTPHIILFGQLILTDQQASQSCSGDTVGNSSSDGNAEKTAISSDGCGCAIHQNGLLENSSDEGSPLRKDHQQSDLRLEIGHCKVFMESDDVGRTLDLTVLGSYEELYKTLANMFGIKSSEMLSGVLYRDATGVVKHTGDVPFSVFLKTARRLTILMDSGSDNVRR
ncbi:AUX_IAA domain-containing protein/B3 domain-containing protein/Auxin_resp domain-containing protein [Cephalotus follicularis]|uniref:Auxin response factor n=1 Tax=Cephalotus follicularis TaxID=3775 RepID=A0A1Q3DJ54_CEPFO|nr:AUX_IAA domain-containing protein/B3 domain-containing protein/Auxin_resp domain-containing protein [Cephalotus follicularis]